MGFATVRVGPEHQSQSSFGCHAISYTTDGSWVLMEFQPYMHHSSFSSVVWKQNWSA